jgi:hypothetical protein
MPTFCLNLSDFGRSCDAARPAGGWRRQYLPPTPARIVPSGRNMGAE